MQIYIRIFVRINCWKKYPRIFVCVIILTMWISIQITMEEYHGKCRNLLQAQIRSCRCPNQSTSLGNDPSLTPLLRLQVQILGEAQIGLVHCIHSSYTEGCLAIIWEPSDLMVCYRPWWTIHKEKFSFESRCTISLKTEECHYHKKTCCDHYLRGLWTLYWVIIIDIITHNGPQGSNLFRFCLCLSLGWLWYYFGFTLGSRWEHSGITQVRAYLWSFSGNFFFSFYSWPLLLELGFCKPFVNRHFVVDPSIIVLTVGNLFDGI